MFAGCVAVTKLLQSRSQKDVLPGIDIMVFLLLYRQVK